MLEHFTRWEPECLVLWRIFVEWTNLKYCLTYSKHSGFHLVCHRLKAVSKRKGMCDFFVSKLTHSISWTNVLSSAVLNFLGKTTNHCFQDFFHCKWVKYVDAAAFLLFYFKGHWLPGLLFLRSLSHEFWIGLNMGF